MQLYEVYDLVQEIPYSFDIQWQQTRILSLFVAQKFCKKRLKLKDIFTLPSEMDDSESWELSDEELEQNKQLQKQIENMLNNKSE